MQSERVEIRVSGAAGTLYMVQIIGDQFVVSIGGAYSPAGKKVCLMELQRMLEVWLDEQEKK